MQITAPNVLMEELDRFEELSDKINARNLNFIKALCATLESHLVTYYAQGATAEGRLIKLAEISLMFKSTAFRVGEQEFSLAAKIVETAGNAETAEEAEKIYGCPEGTVCVDGNCVVIGG